MATPNPRSRSERASAGLSLLADGLTTIEVAERLSVTSKTVRNWQRGRIPREGLLVPSECPRCEGAALDSLAYAHLLGLYLGDGYVSARSRGRFVLTIANDAAYYGLIDECMDSMARVRCGGAVWIQSQEGCASIQSSWNHWPCLFPQHGPGAKHKRPIVLEPWQLEIVEQHTDRFIRGLFHSDGCRSLNRITRHFASGDRTYVYPRYFFSNESEDIRRLCEWGLDRIGVEHKRNRPNCISVARRASVEVMDEIVGPKY